MTEDLTQEIVDKFIENNPAAKQVLRLFAIPKEQYFPVLQLLYPAIAEEAAKRYHEIRKNIWAALDVSINEEDIEAMRRFLSLPNEGGKG